jgi:hypothetical protein
MLGNNFEPLLPSLVGRLYGTSLKSHGTISLPVSLAKNLCGWPSNSAMTSQGSFKHVSFDIYAVQCLPSLLALS